MTPQDSTNQMLVDKERQVYRQLFIMKKNESPNSG